MDTSQVATLADLVAGLGGPEVVAREPGGLVWSRSHLRTEVARLVEVLGRAAPQVERPVALALPNGLAFLACFLGLAGAGRIAAPFNPALPAVALRDLIEDCRASAVLVPEGPSPAREAAEMLELPTWTVRLAGGSLEVVGAVPRGAVPDAPGPSAPALFLHTSGTTGRPKGVALTHAHLVNSASHIRDGYGLGARDSSLVVMPLFHVHGLVGVALSTLAAGGALSLPARFSAGAFWEQVAEAEASWYSAVPTIHQILLDRSEADVAPRGVFRFIRSCSSSLAPATWKRLEERFASPVVEAYGMTEAAHQMCSNPMPPGERRAGTVGLPVGTEVSIRNGEVLVRGDHVITAYHRASPAIQAEAFVDGWFRTGDLGQFEEGYLRLIGRTKEQINRGGEKISPQQVDEALLEHPAVARAVAFGAPDPKYGEEVYAAVILRAPTTPEALQAWCRDRLAAFAVPRRIFVLDELPLSPTGKVQRLHMASRLGLAST